MATLTSTTTTTYLSSTTTVETSTEKSSPDGEWWTIVVYAAIGTLGMLNNVLVTVVFVADRKLLRQSALIVGVTVSHFLCALAIGGTGIFRLTFPRISDPATAWNCVLLIMPACYPFAFECNGFLLGVIGVERLLAMLTPNWFYRFWTDKIASYLVVACYLCSLATLGAALNVAYYRPPLTWMCNYLPIFGKEFILFTCVVSVIGGTMAVTMTLAALFVGARRVQNVPLLSGELGRYQKQLRLTRSMLTVALCDFCLVVLPNLIRGIQIINPLLEVTTAISRYTNIVYCFNTVVSLIPYLAFNSQFRRAFLRLFKRNQVTPSQVTQQQQQGS